MVYTTGLSTNVVLKNGTKRHWEASQVNRKIQYVGYLKPAKRILQSILKLVPVFLLSTCLALADSPKLARDLREADSVQTVDVIVQFNDETSKKKNSIKHLVKKYDLDLIDGALGLGRPLTGARQIGGLG